MPINLNLLRAELSRMESKGQNNFLDNFVPMPQGEGTVVIRLLPPNENSGLELPYVATRTHKLNGKNYHCPCNFVGNPGGNGGKWVGNCPACNYCRTLWKESETANKETANALQTEYRQIKANPRFYWNAIVRTVTTKAGEVEHNVGPLIYSCGTQVNSKLIRAWFGDTSIGEDPLGDFTDLENGRDLKVIKRIAKGGDGFPNYNESKFLNPSVAGTNEEIARWMSSLHDLQSLRKVLPYDELKLQVDIHRGLVDDPDTAFSKETLTESNEDEVAQQAPPPRRSVPVSAPVANRTAPVVNKPAAVEDNDEAGIDEDFLAKLRSM